MNLIRPVRPVATAVGLWLAASAAMADPPMELKKAPPNATRHGSMAEANASAAPDDLICTHESTIGSHMKRTVCLSRADRERQKAADQEALRQLQSDPRAKGKAGKDPL